MGKGKGTPYIGYNLFLNLSCCQNYQKTFRPPSYYPLCKKASIILPKKTKLILTEIFYVENIIIRLLKSTEILYTFNFQINYSFYKVIGSKLLSDILFICYMVTKFECITQKNLKAIDPKSQAKRSSNFRYPTEKLTLLPGINNFF